MDSGLDLDFEIDWRTRREQLIKDFKLIAHECSQLRNDLNDETDARKSADSDERNARINADNRLQSQIDTIIQRLDTNEKNIADLQTRMKTTEERTDRLEKIIFGEQYINETERIPIDDSMRPISDEEINDAKVINDDKSDVILHPSDDEPIVEVN